MKIFGIGSNYKKHIEEMKSSFPIEPTVFCKHETSLLKNNDDFYLPSFSKDVHHEIELVVRINKVGKNIDQDFANQYYSEVALGVDFTARDKQMELKNLGLPWDLAKAWDNSAPISSFLPLSNFKSVQNIELRLDVNGNTKQIGNTSDMLFSVDFLISFLSKYFTLKVGDLIYTGTPYGVSQVNIGDRIEGYIDSQKALDFKVK